MSKERRSKAVIIQSTLLSLILFFNGCIGMTYVKKIDSEGLVPVESLWHGKGRYFPLESSYYPEPAASKIGKHIKSTATPDEWAAIQCLSGASLNSVKLTNSIDLCKDCYGAYALKETFRSALAHALEGTLNSPPNCTAVRSLKLQVTFMRGGKPKPLVSVWLLPVVVPLFMGSCLFSGGLLCPIGGDMIVRINAVAQPAQGVEVYAVGFGAATRVTASGIYDSERGAVFLAFAEALKALATDLKKQLDVQPQSGHSRLHSET